VLNKFQFAMKVTLTYKIFENVYNVSFGGTLCHRALLNFRYFSKNSSPRAMFLVLAIFLYDAQFRRNGVVYEFLDTPAPDFRNIYIYIKEATIMFGLSLEDEQFLCSLLFPRLAVWVNQGGTDRTDRLAFSYAYTWSPVWILGFYMAWNLCHSLLELS
jgi:hypothetical protein